MKLGVKEIIGLNFYELIFGFKRDLKKFLKRSISLSTLDLTN